MDVIGTLERFQRGELLRRPAMLELNVDHGGLLDLLEVNGLEGPKPSAEAGERMVESALPLLGREAVLGIAEAGPLVRLARADQLALLTATGLTLAIVDQAQWEACNDRRRAIRERAEAFLHQDGPAMSLLKPDFGAVTRDADMLRGKAPPMRTIMTAAGRSHGQKAMQVALSGGSVLGLSEFAGEAEAEFLGRMDEVTLDGGREALLLYEDADAVQRASVVGQGILVVSVTALVIAMERRGLLPSAKATLCSLRSAAGERPRGGEG